MRWLLFLLLFGCQHHNTPQHTKVSRTPEYQQQIDDLIQRDADNKKWARIYLHEIDVAMRNDDIAAYVFFVNEIEKIPLEIVPPHLRNEPGYVTGPSTLELHFRLRWFEQAVLLYKQYSEQTK